MTKAYLKFGSKPKSYLPKISSRRFALVAFKNVAYKEDGKEEKKEDKKDIETLADLLKELNEIKTGLEAQMEQKAGKAIDEKLIAVNQAIEDLKNIKPEVTAEELKKIREDLATTVKAFDLLQARVKSGNHTPVKEVKSFNDSLEETVKAHEEEIKSFKKGDQEKRFEMKAAGDMSMSVNFPSGTTFTQDVRQTPLIEKPYNRVWLGDVLPQGTSNGSSILYPKENGGEGGAALWTDKTADKAQMDFDLTGQSAYFKWLAGIVIIEREMLDDIAFLTSYLRNKMLISLKIAENNFILNGSADTNPVQGMLAVATAYDGAYTNAVDKIIDAAWGQLVEDTFDFYNPTNIILTPRNSVAIGLNTASGSGEYDLPAGYFPNRAFVGDQAQLAGLGVIRTTEIGTDNFLAFDKNALMFVKRMQPELRMFEDAALAKKNKIMFRVEERATLAIFNNAALVQGTLGLSES